MSGPAVPPVAEINGVPRSEIRMCVPVELPLHLHLDALARAAIVRGDGFAAVRDLASGEPWPFPGLPARPESIAVRRDRRWPKGYVIGVRFLNGSRTLQDRVLAAMKHWEAYCSLTFARHDAADAECRVQFASDGASWSYLGMDCLSIPANQETMHYGWFTDATDDAELFRTVEHETGHLLDAEHEHQRQDFIDELDPAANYAYYAGPPNRWSQQQIAQQVLTAFPTSEVDETPTPELTSIMMYGCPAALTKRRIAIPGGTRITPMDGAFMASIYGPPAGTPTGPVTPTTPSGPTDPTGPILPYKPVVIGAMAVEQMVPRDGVPARYSLLVPARMKLDLIVKPSRSWMRPRLDLGGLPGGPVVLIPPGRALASPILGAGVYEIDVTSTFPIFGGSVFVKATAARS